MSHSSLPIVIKLLSLTSFLNDFFGESSLHKKWSFPLRIFSVNVTKSAVSFGFRSFTKEILNPLNSNPTKWSNILKQFVGNLPMNFLSMFDHFMKLALKGLMKKLIFYAVVLSVRVHGYSKCSPTCSYSILNKSLY